MPRLNVWIRGLANAAINGGVTAALATSLFVDVEHIQEGDFGKVAMIAGLGALQGLLNYLKQSPLPQAKEE